MTTKNTKAKTNGIKYDSHKTRYELLEPFFIEAVAKVLTLGSKKYADDNWKKVEPLADRYYGALMRHIMAWRGGEKTDSESGMPHLAHAACNLYFLMWNDRNETKSKKEKVRPGKA